jgi:hypothetical protein
MRTSRCRLGQVYPPWRALLLYLCCLIPASLSAQQSASTGTTSGPQTSQAASILQQALAAQTGGAPVTDVTMTGSVTVTRTFNTPAGIAVPSLGSGVDSGTISYVATASGQGQSTVTLTSGMQTEIRDISSGSPILYEAGTDGVTHAITTQSAFSPHPAWFYPALIVSAGLSSSNYASTYIGQESWNGSAAQHVAIWLLPSASPSVARFPQRITQHDVFLDPTSLLPVAMTFTVHPYDPVNPNGTILPLRGDSVDGLEQVTFSDYRKVQGRAAAFHIHTSLQVGAATIITDTQLTSVSFDTGATITIPR